MENLKVKVIGVLREREGVDNTEAGGSKAVVRQLSKVSALDLPGVLNSRRRLEWTKEWLKKNQNEFLSKENIRKEMQLRKNEIYHLNCFLDITDRQFRYLVTILAPLVTMLEPQRKKKSFSAEERIAITLKYLATGEVHSCRNYCFRASKSVILKMISEICLKMYELLKDQFLSLPKTDEQWLEIVSEFERKDNLSHCLGNMSMQQVCFYSTTNRNHDDVNPPLIFTAIVDSNNNFMYADIERTKARSHDQIFEQSTICAIMEGGLFQLPTSGDHESSLSTYYFAGCDALPVNSYLLTPERQPTQDSSKNLTLRDSYYSALESANHHTTKAFCILCNVFPILAQPLRLGEEDARKIALGCVALYNFLRKTNHSYYNRTERIAGKADKVEEEQDCILITSEEQQSEHDEFTPSITVTSCFLQVRKQRGDTQAGLTKRQHLEEQFAKWHCR